MGMLLALTRQRPEIEIESTGDGYAVGSFA
jgi:hypothetical protein